MILVVLSELLGQVKGGISDSGNHWVSFLRSLQDDIGFS
jgi:hypothetical protein